MSSKILIADDSLTIQKVISITLASTGHTLEMANSYQELVEKLKDGDTNLVLLDFNLSENNDGYSLAKKVKEISPSTNVIMMYGTFDTIDEGLLIDNDVADKVVKPFESNLFIKKCNDVLGFEGELLSEPTSEESDSDDELTEMENVFTNDDQWVMNSPLAEKDDEQTLDQESASPEDSNLVMMESALTNQGEGGNILNQEIEDWGMSVPSKIEGLDEIHTLPPEIDEEEGEENSDIIELSPSWDDASEVKPEFQSVHELVLDDDDNIEAPLGLEASITSDDSQLSEEVTEELAKDIEEELDASKFWAADDEEESDINFDETQEFEAPDLTSESVEEAPLESNFENLISQPSFESVNEESLVEALFEKIKPMLDEKIESYIKKHLDESAWEIIPDLAENVIKEEVRRISDSVIDSGASFKE